MTPADLAILGTYLYGTRWHSALARDLAVHPRTMRYWASGRWPVPDRRAVAIAALAAQRYSARADAARRRYEAMAAAIAGCRVRNVLLGAGVSP